MRCCRRRNSPSPRRTNRARIEAADPSGEKRHATTIAPRKLRPCRHGGRSQQPAAAEDDRDRHEAVCDGGGDGRDTENPPAELDPHHRPDRQHGLAARLDRRHHRRRSRRCAVSRRDRACADRREVSRRRELCRGLARQRGRRAQAAGGARCGAVRPVQGACREPAQQRPARSAGHLPGLCHARRR